MVLGLVRRQGQDEHIILTENGVQKARSLHRVPLEQRFVISELKKVRGTSLERQGGELVSNDCDATGPRPSGHRRVYLTTKVVARLGATPGCSVSVWDRTQKDVECDWKRHWPTKRRV